MRFERSARALLFHLATWFAVMVLANQPSAEATQPDIQEFRATASLRPTIENITTCEGSDGRYIEAEIRLDGPVISNDPRLGGSYTGKARMLINLSNLKGTWRDDLEILDPSDGRLKMRGRAYGTFEGIAPIRTLTVGDLAGGDVADEASTDEGEFWPPRQSSGGRVVAEGRVVHAHTLIALVIREAGGDPSLLLGPRHRRLALRRRRISVQMGAPHPTRTADLALFQAPPGCGHGHPSQMDEIVALAVVSPQEVEAVACEGTNGTYVDMRVTRPGTHREQQPDRSRPVHGESSSPC
jgi:hypothetical protein